MKNRNCDRALAFARRFRLSSGLAPIWAVLAFTTLHPDAATGQVVQSHGPSLDSLVARAMIGNPVLAAARHRIEAARARVSAAGSLPDPMLMAGLLNVPVNNFSLSDDEMTMKMIGLRQTLPFPGKLRLARRVAEFEAAEAFVAIDSLQRAIAREVKHEYYEIAYIDAALGVTRRLDALSGDVVKVASLRYSTGRGTQQEVLRATLDATRLNETANDLRERRQIAVARLAEILAEPAFMIDSVTVPRRLAAAAVTPDPSAIRFSSREIGSPVAGGPLESLAELQLRGVRASSGVKRRAAMRDIAAARAELARREHLPDFDLSLEYGQRSGRSPADDEGPSAGRPDMVSFVVAIPLAIQRRKKQGALAAAAGADLAAASAEQSAVEALVRSEVARLYSEASRSRTQLALLVKALIPQARASLNSSVTSYQSGPGDLTSVLDAQRTLLEFEIGYHRAMVDFAQRIAELDSVVGGETIR